MANANIFTAILFETPQIHFKGIKIKGDEKFETPQDSGNHPRGNKG